MSPNLIGLLPPALRREHRIATVVDDHPLSPFVIGVLVQGTGTARPERQQRTLGTHTWVSSRFFLYGVTLVLAGNGRYLDADGHLHVVGPGDLLRMHSRGRQARTPLLKGEGWAECALWVRGRINTELARLGVWAWSPSCAPVHPPAAAVRLFVDHHQQVLAAEGSGLDLLRSTIAVVDDLVRLTSDHRAVDDLVERAKRLIAAEPDRLDLVERVARDLGVGAASLQRRFRQQVGISPAAYQREQRMLQATTLLQRHSVKETARLVGFEDPASFSRSFKRVTGVTPSRYRQD